jgi:protease-4
MKRRGQSPGWERAALEKLAFAALEEQRATRRWRNLCGWPGWLSLSVLAWALMYGAHRRPTSLPHTAVVEIKGEIAAGADASAEFRGGRACAPRFEDEGSQAWCC